MGTDTKVDFRHTAAKDDTVVLVDFAIRLAVRTTDILVEAVTDIGSLLGGMVVEVGLRAGDTLIDITVELTNLFSKLCDIVASDIGILAETKLHYLILKRAEVGTDLIFQRMIVVAISTAELPTTVVQSSGVHRHTGIAHTGILRNRYSVEQILRTVLEPFSSELKTVAKHGDVETNVLGDTALPLKILIDESGDSRTVNDVVAEAVAHIVAVHRGLDSVVTNIVNTNLTIACAELQQVDDILADREELLLVDTPTQRHRGESGPALILGQTATAITTDNS